MEKRLSHLIISFLIIFVVIICCVNAIYVFGESETDIVLSDKEIKGKGIYKGSYKASMDKDIDKVVLLDENIIKITTDYFYDSITIRPLAIGEANIYVHFDDGSSETVHVTITDKMVLNKSHLNVKGSYYNYYHYDYYADDGEDGCYYDGKRSRLAKYVIVSIGANNEYDLRNMIYESEEHDEYYWDKGGYKAELEYDDFIMNRTGIKIIDVQSSDNSIVKIVKGELCWGIIPVGPGTATITCTDASGNTEEFTVTVPKEFVVSHFKKVTSVKTVKYGATKATGKTIPGASITLSIDGKKRKAKADSKGKYSIKIPIKKIGTKLKYTFSLSGCKYKINSTIRKPSVKVSSSDVYRNTRRIKITVKNVNKGDVINVKVAGKTYKKKIRKKSKKVVCKFTIKAKKTAGSKIKTTVKNKFGQTLKTKKKIVYYAATIRKGYTKKQCKLIPGWEHPEDTYVNGAYEIWWYDDYEYYLKFRHGRLYGWHS